MAPMQHASASTYALYDVKTFAWVEGEEDYLSGWRYIGKLSVHTHIVYPSQVPYIVHCTHSHTCTLTLTLSHSVSTPPWPCWEWLSVYLKAQGVNPPMWIMDDPLVWLRKPKMATTLAHNYIYHQLPHKSV